MLFKKLVGPISQRLWFQVHFPQQEFVAGMGAEGIVYGGKTARDDYKVMLVDRFFKPLYPFFNFSKATIHPPYSPAISSKSLSLPPIGHVEGIWPGAPLGLLRSAPG
jgi:hypothetical protein